MYSIIIKDKTTAYFKDYEAYNSQCQNIQVMIWNLQESLNYERKPTLFDRLAKCLLAVTIFFRYDAVHNIIYLPESVVSIKVEWTSCISVTKLTWLLTTVGADMSGLIVLSGLTLSCVLLTWSFNTRCEYVCTKYIMRGGVVMWVCMY